MKKRKKKSWFNSFTEPFEYFYLGFLASVGLTLGTLMVFNTLRGLIESQINFDILIYSRIIFSIFYLFFIGYTYYLLDMNKNKSLRNGFISVVIIYIIIQVYYWISLSLK